MIEQSPTHSLTILDAHAREDYANHLLGIILLAGTIARGEIKIDRLTAAYLPSLITNTESLPTFNQYLTSGTGAEFAPHVTAGAKQRMQALSLEVRERIDALNRDPASRERFSNLLSCVADVVPEPSAHREIVLAAAKLLRGGHGMLWGDVQKTLGFSKASSDLSQLTLPPKPAARS